MKPWPKVRLGEVLTPVSRPEPVDPSRTYHILGAHWYAGGLYTKDVKPGSGIQAKEVYRVEEGDFVYNRLFAWKGSFALATADNAGCYVSNEFPCFVIRKDRADGRYLWRYFSRAPVWAEALGLSTGGTPTSRNRLKEERLLAMEVPLPPLEGQRRTVARIEELAAKIEEARDLRQQAAEQAGVIVRNAISRVIGKGWPVVHLQEAVDPARGITYGIVQAGEHIPDGVPYIRVSDMARPKLTIDGMLRTAPEIAARYSRSAGELPRSKLRGIKGQNSKSPTRQAAGNEPPSIQYGDIVFAIRATVGKMRFVPRELDGANLTQGTARIAPSTKATGRYLFWVLQSREVTEIIQNATKGSTFKEITLGKLRTISIPHPPLPAQHRIVAELDALQAKVDALKRLQAETAVELDPLLPSILDRAFKGEL